MRRNNSALGLIFLMFVCLSLAGAEQDLVFEIRTDLNGFQSSFFAQTSDSSNSGFDALDVLKMSNPEESTSFFSRISSGGTKDLILDSWNAESDSSRTLNLVYNASGVSYEDTLVFSWDENGLTDSGGEYSFVLNDYGSDSSRETLVDSVDMNSESSYSVDNTVPLRYLKLETAYSYDSSCGDGVVTSPSEECDGSNLNGGSCVSEGFVSGTLSCIAPGLPNECTFDYSQCQGESPGGGGGSSSTCQNQCIFGQRRCADNSSYQLCGDFNGDGCSEWGAIDKCLGINPLCQGGFCFGCVSDDDCDEGICVNGKCEVNCSQSCADWGFSCGKRLLCGRLIDCGSCGEGLFCVEGSCSIVPEDALKVSEDGLSSNLSNYLCSPWSECDVSFKFEELLSGSSWFTGKKSRLCFDSNGIYSTIKEEEDCLLNVEVDVKITNICGEDYIEIFDKKTNKLLARTMDSRYGIGQAISVFLLPGEEINCAPEEEQFKVYWWERLLFLSDIKKIWGIVI